MFPRPPRSAIACLTAGLLASATLHADQDAPPVDINKLLKDLTALQQQQAVQAKTSKQAAIQQITAAAASPERALKMWEDALMATEMAGAGKEAQQLKNWLNTEGELFKEKEVQNAVHLHLEWLVLSLQRSNGATVKELLPSVMNYVKELVADQAWMDALDDAIQKDKAAPGPNKQRNQKTKDDVAIKKTHDGVLRRSVNGSIIVQWLKLTDYLTLEKWELNPGNLDGIYKNIVLPELRNQKDPRVLEYWDFKLQKERDVASKTKLTFETDKFNNERRPTLMWNKAQEYVFLGQKNRAVSEMYNIIKTYPTHPDALDWIYTLQGLIAPSAPETPATSAAPAAPAPTAAPAPAPSPNPTAVPSTASLPGAQ